MGGHYSSLLKPRPPENTPTPETIYEEDMRRMRELRVMNKEAPQEIISGLFIGPILCLKDIKKLKTKGITHILSICEVDELMEDFIHKVVDIVDLPSSDLSPYFFDCMNFIDSARKSGGILVHCQAGISRSGAITVAYVMYNQRLNLASALEFVRKKRSVVQPNTGFMKQLEDFQFLLYKNPPSRNQPTDSERLFEKAVKDLEIVQEELDSFGPLGEIQSSKSEHSCRA